ncbi:MAG: hypothetical protein V1798_03970 [Pseudomonadota bacterium]
MTRLSFRCFLIIGSLLSFWCNVAEATEKDCRIGDSGAPAILRNVGVPLLISERDIISRSYFENSLLVQAVTVTDQRPGQGCTLLFRLTLRTDLYSTGYGMGFGGKGQVSFMSTTSALPPRIVAVYFNGDDGKEFIQAMDYVLQHWDQAKITVGQNSRLIFNLRSGLATWVGVENRQIKAFVGLWEQGGGPKAPSDDVLVAFPFSYKEHYKGFRDQFTTYFGVDTTSEKINSLSEPEKH